VELVVVTVTENDAVASGLSLTDDWLLATTGGVLVLVARMTVMLTSPLRPLTLVTVIEIVPA
jgi:hypothetical protein